MSLLCLPPWCSRADQRSLVWPEWLQSGLYGCMACGAVIVGCPISDQLVGSPWQRSGWEKSWEISPSGSVYCEAETETEEQYTRRQW